MCSQKGTQQGTQKDTQKGYSKGYTKVYTKACTQRLKSVFLSFDLRSIRSAKLLLGTELPFQKHLFLNLFKPNSNEIF